MADDRPKALNICDTTPSPNEIASETSQERIERLQTLLNRKLGPEFISQRQGGGGQRISYLEGWRAIQLANEVFGFNGWFTSIKDLTVDYCDVVPETGRFNIGVSAILRVWLRDGASHEDIGYGRADNVKTKGDGLDKAKKEAVTDALKRALRNFGNLLGNCLYDKAHIQSISSIKPLKTSFDWNNLHRSDSGTMTQNSSASAGTQAVGPTAPVAPRPPPKQQAPKQQQQQKPMPPPPRPVARAQTVGAPTHQPAAPSRLQQVQKVPDPDESMFDDLMDDNFGDYIPTVTEDSGFVDGVTLAETSAAAQAKPQTKAHEDSEHAMRQLLAAKKEAALRKKREREAAVPSVSAEQRSPEQAMKPPPTPTTRSQSRRPNLPKGPQQRAQSTVVAGPKGGALPSINVGGSGARLASDSPTSGFQSARGVKRGPEHQAREPLSELDIDGQGEIKRMRA